MPAHSRASGFPHAILAAVAAVALAGGAIPAAGQEQPAPAGSVGGAAPGSRSSGTDATAPTRLEKPLRVRFRLADGVQVTGDLTEWDREGIDGSFGRRAWTELEAEDIWRLYRRLMDRDVASGWIDLGRVLLRASLDQPRAVRRAEEALEMALRLDPGMAGAIEAVRKEVDAIRQRRAAAAAAAEAERLRRTCPQAADWPADPWPALTPERQEEAVGEMRADATGILDRAGLMLQPVETAHYLVYSDAPREDAARWALHLEDLHVLLARRFGLPHEERVFWGKAVVFVFTERDRFVLVEAEAFRQLVPRHVSAVCHPVGGKVFVNAHVVDDPAAFDDALFRAAVHGFVHCYRTPRPLPMWAGEGLAAYFASVMRMGGYPETTRREEALRHIRNGGDLGRVLSATYPADDFPPAADAAHSVGSLLIEMMIREQPEGFLKWVNAVKDGEDWVKALRTEFGATAAQLAAALARYHALND